MRRLQCGNVANDSTNASGKIRLAPQRSSPIGRLINQSEPERQGLGQADAISSPYKSPHSQQQHFHFIDLNRRIKLAPSKLLTHVRMGQNPKPLQILKS